MVLLEMKDELTADMAVELFAKTDAMLRQIPGVIDVKTAKNFSTRSPQVTHASLMTMKDKETLANYRPHPIHVQAQGMLKPYLKGSTVADIEI
jgi:hypothetical protein